MSWKYLVLQGLESTLYYNVLKEPWITMSWKYLVLLCLERTLNHNVLKESCITMSWKYLVLQGCFKLFYCSSIKLFQYSTGTASSIHLLLFFPSFISTVGKMQSSFTFNIDSIPIHNSSLNSDVRFLQGLGWDRNIRL